jgi:membrane-bound lytic murein transglycosylase D
MRVFGLQVRIAVLLGLAALASSCQSAKKTVAASVPPPPPTQASQTSTLSAPSSTLAASSTTEPAQPAGLGDSTGLPSANATSDPVGDLVSHVEQQYQSGLSKFQAGNTDGARQDFDQAFNALLESNLDIRSDDRLEKEFDLIVDGVNHLNLGEAATESEAQTSEPAPIDETNGITPAASADVKAKAQAEIKSTHSDLPLMMTDQVAGYISYFSNRGRGTFERAFARSGRYHDMMVRILKQEGVPQDLIYLAQAESGFQPTAVSRAGARGIWQFMGSRAQGYGLRRSLWVDDRQDPEKSTRAAAHHLRDLYAQFGDWYLAMAAYNSGPGTVQAAVKRTGYADFWELYRRNVLPKETRNYVPIILAVTIMTKNLSHYGFDDVSMDEPAAFDSVAINYPVDLRLVADCVDATPQQLQQLNPGLLRLSTPKDGTFELHLPAGTRQEYQTAMASIPAGMRLWWRYPTVHSGDTLASLARRYRVTVKSIVEANQLDSTDLDTNAKVVIPLAPNQHHAGDNATFARRITRYKVRRGDTVQSVAENFGVPAQMLRRWNGLRSDSLHGRTVLALHLPVSPSGESASATTTTSATRSHKPAQIVSAKLASGSRASQPSTTEQQASSSEETSVVHHKVKSGETFYSIASTYRITVAALKRSNQNIATLRPGMILVVQQTR